MDVLMAATPILLTLALLMTSLPAWVAPASGTVAALVLALVWFGAPGERILQTLGGSAWTLVEVLAIIAGGVLLSRVMDRTGAQERLARWLSSGGGPTVASALLMVHGVVPFMETVTGFGVSVMIGLPLLLGFGFTPYRAALLTLLGLMIGPWGSMGPGTLLASQDAGVSLREMGLASGVVNGVAFLASGIVAAVVAGRGSAHGADAEGRLLSLRRIGPGPLVSWLGAGVVSALVLWGLVLAANLLLGTPVAGAVATLVLSVLWLLVLRRGRLRPGPGRPLVPYLVLMGGTVAGQLLHRSVGLGPLGEVISSPALWSFTAALTAAWLLHLARTQHSAVLRDAGRLWMQAGLPTALYMVLGVMVAGGGLAAVMGQALTGLGPAYLFLVPFVGGLSGFITASGTGANAMVGSIQVAAAQSLGVSPLWMMALQNSSAGWGIIAGPARIELAYRLAMPHQRPEHRGLTATRRNLLVVLLPTVLVSLVVYGLIAVLVLPATG
ncbi:L-lactate permease [Micrococcus terreus]|uniref:L-lactate permease n=1 Tax=Micrococcus terreus TaxID=574650 RepID=UPI0023F810C1|nr:L-lactate permease [Micrococcus terreus]